MFVKKVEAIIESKCVVNQVEGSMWNYGGNYSTFAVAEKSGDFLDKKIRYVIVFRVAGKRKEFDVSEEIYNQYEENDTGILEYNGKMFLSFTK